MNENLMTKGPQINFLKIWSLGLVISLKLCKFKPKREKLIHLWDWKVIRGSFTE